MEKSARLFYVISQYLILLWVTLGYWVEMAEEMEASDTGSKLGKGLLILLKLLVLPR